MFQSSITRFLNQGIGLAGLLALALSAGLATADSASNTHHKEVITVSFDTEDGSNETVTVINMAIGDSEVVVTESGREAFITRHDTGLDIELGSETVSLELLGLAELGHGLHVGDVDVNQWINDDGQKRIRILRGLDMNMTVDLECEGMDECEQPHKIIMIDQQDGTVDVRNLDGHEVIITSSGNHQISEVELYELLESLDIALDDIDTAVHMNGQYRDIQVIRKKIHVKHESEDNDQ